MREDTEQVCTFLSSFHTEKKIYVPKLYDGTFETALATNNTLQCEPADENFRTLWETLRDKPDHLSYFIEIYDNDEETSKTLSEVLSIQKNNIPRAYTLLSLCLRSKPTQLMGGELADKKSIFTKQYLNNLKNYQIPYCLKTPVKQECLVFQDLTYLSLEEVKEFNSTNNCLLITNKKEHIYLFDGANCSQVDEYFLIWK